MNVAGIDAVNKRAGEHVGHGCKSECSQGADAGEFAGGGTAGDAGIGTEIGFGAVSDLDENAHIGKSLSR